MYVYIFEDGTTQRHIEPPSDVDLEMIADGLLMVLWCEDVNYVCEDGSLSDLEECEFVTDVNGGYHVQKASGK